MKRSTVAILLLLLVAGSAMADPTLLYTCTSIGDGLYAFDFRLDPAGQVTYAVNLGFMGNISQIPGFGTAVNSERIAREYDGLGFLPMYPAYSSAMDTWVYSPYGDCPINGVNPIPGAAPLIDGFAEGTTDEGITFYSFAVGEQGQLTDKKLVHLVADSDGGSWVGWIVHNGISYPTSGTFYAPEPATMSLLGLGAVTLLKHRKMA